MMELTVRMLDRVRGSGAPMVCIGMTRGGQRHAWLDHPLADLTEGVVLKVDAGRTLPCPEDLSDTRLALLLRFWPAWRIVRAAGLEIGSKVLVLGDGWLVHPVLELCRVHGCLWCAVPTGSGFKAAADLVIIPADAVNESSALKQALPGEPDAVIVLGSSDYALSRAMACCRTKGIIVVAHHASESIDQNLYPDVHRRGLRVTGVSTTMLTETCLEEWEVAALHLARLHDQGVFSAEEDRRRGADA